MATFAPKPSESQLPWYETREAYDISLETAITANEEAVEAIAASADPLQPLDLWPEFNAAGGAGSWVATTFATYIAGVKSDFAEHILNGSIIETDRGVSSNGTDHIWSYRAGTGPVKALLVSGLHSDETISHFVGLRWFQAFSTSTHPVMVALRKRLTVEWIACANPFGYNTAKENANGVNLNRNFKFYETTSTAPNKGATAFSEVESQIVKAVVDEGNMCVIDLHARGPIGTNDLGYSDGSAWIAADRSVPLGALETWKQNYSDVVGGPPYEFLLPHEPTLSNWALWYGRWDGTRRGSTAMLLETSTDHFGSTALKLSRNAAKAMCGFITTYLGTWLNKGSTPAPAYSMVTRATGPATTTGITWIDGGNRLDASTWTPLTWGAIQPSSGGTAGRVIRFVAPYPCDIIIRVEGFATYSAAADGAAFRGTVGISFDDDTGPHPSSTSTFSIESTDANRRAMFQATYKFDDLAPDGSTVHEARIWFQRNSGGTADINIARAFIELVPRWEAYPHATVRQGV